MAIRGSKRRAADQEEARWYDDECGSEKPFICQAFGISKPFLLTVSTELRLAGGYLVGAGTVMSSTLAQVGFDYLGTKIKVPADEHWILPYLRLFSETLALARPYSALMPP